MLRALDPETYDVVPVGITREGAYVLADADPDAYALRSDRLPEVLDDGSRVLWPDSTASRTLRVAHADGSVSSLGEIDVVFPILHGPYGEDGTVQGMLELAGLPYVGAGVLASAVGMDKHFTKTVLSHAGIAVAPWVTVTQDRWARDEAAVRRRVDELGWPVFVKPSRAGSSVGVSRVTGSEGLDDALVTAFAEDSRVLVEAAVPGRELEIGVLDGRHGGSPRTSVAGEVVLDDGRFYDFAAKYLGADGVRLDCPAEIDDDELLAMADIAVRAFQAIDGRGLARVDFFLGEGGFVVNEINTMPGFTPISMFPRMWLESGLTYPELIDELIDLALER